MTVFFLLLLSIFAIVYSLAFLLGFFATLLDPWRPHKREEPVSVVLCARDEEHNLPATLLALEQQDYPTDLIEFILIDHNSSDRTYQLFSEFVARDPAHRKVIKIADEIEGLRGKAAPWHAGMLEASHSIVLTTGADCIVPQQWISRTVALFDEKTQIVSGAALLIHSDRMNGLYARTQNLDMMLIQGMGYCLSVLGFGGAGLSNNYALRREAYLKTGGFPAIGFSICEDVRLSNAILKIYGTKSLRYHLDRNATPTTDPEPIRRLANMKIRWSMGTRRLGAGGLSMIGVAFFAHLLVPLFAIFGSGAVRESALFTIIAGWCFNALFVLGISVRMKRTTDLIALPIFLPYFWIYTSLLLIPVWLRLPVRWKGLWVREPK